MNQGCQYFLKIGFSGEKEEKTFLYHWFTLHMGLWDAGPVNLRTRTRALMPFFSHARAFTYISVSISHIVNKS